MTVQSTISRADYSGNGATTLFPVPFYFLDPTHLIVYLTTTASGTVQTLVIGVDYMVSGTGVSSGGTLTMTVAPTSGQALAILRNVPQLQLTHYTPNNPFPAASHENALDLLTMEVQQITELQSRQLTFPANATAPSSLPGAASRAGNLLGFDSNGNPITVAPVAGSAASLATDLLNSIAFNKGAGQVAYNQSLAYAVPTMGAYLQQFAINVKAAPYLCKGDGSTNDSVAFQQAVTDAAAKGVPVFVPPGNYMLNSIVLPSNIVVFGCGIGLSILTQISGANDLWHTADPGSATTFTSNVKVSDLTLQGTVSKVQGVFTGSISGTVLTITQVISGVVGPSMTVGGTNVTLRTKVSSNGTGSGGVGTYNLDTASTAGSTTITATDGFQQVLHLMFTQGATDVTIERVKFTGFRGDGLHIGTGNERGQAPTQVRHNQRVKVRYCIFDGEVKDNRNAITIEDCDGYLIEHNHFTRCSRPNMPGPIDIENDGEGVNVILTNGQIKGNSFYDVEGAGFINVNMHLAQTGMTVPFRRLVIEDNYMDTGNTAYTSFINLQSLATASLNDPAHDILVRGNYGRNASQAWVIQGMKGVRFENNTLQETRVGSSITDSSNTKSCVDIEFWRNTLYKNATDTSGGTAIYNYGCTNFTFIGNVVDTFGRSDNAANYAIDFVGTGSQFNPIVEDNTFRVPTANTNAWDVRNDGPTLGTNNFRHARNRLVNVTGAAVVFNNAILPQDAQTPTGGFGWLGYGAPYAPPAFWKDSVGEVCLEGGWAAGTLNSVLFVLPVGFRPPGTIVVDGRQYTGTVWSTVQISITAAGNVIPLNNTSNNLLLVDGIRFRATQ